MSQRPQVLAGRLSLSKPHMLALLLLGLAVVALLLAIHFGTPINRNLWSRTFFDALHVPVFAAIAICLYLISGHLPLKGSAQRLGVSMAVVVVLSGLSEAAQIPGPRDASFSDLLADWLGAGSALLLMMSVSPGHGGWKARVMWATGGLLILAIALQPIATVTAAYIERNLQQPVIFAAESRLNHKFMRAQNARLSYSYGGTSGAIAARVTLGNGPWPGLIFEDIWPDWSAYKELVIDIGAVGDARLELNLRVHDWRHKNSEQAYTDRFNTSLVLAPEMPVVRIPIDAIAAAPKGRAMEMSAIQGIVFFADKNEAGKEFVLRSIRLE